MSIFQYKARDRKTREVSKGVIEAPNQVQAVRILRAKNLLILSVGASHDLTLKLPFLHRVTSKDRVLFARQLAVMMRAGLPILGALQAIAEQTTNKTLKKTIVEMVNEIEGGTALSAGFASHPAIFPPIFVSVSKIGEKSGKLEDVLERLANQLEKDDELLAKIKGAMVYPVFVLCSLVIVIIVILVYIIPQLKGLFDDASISLPLITRLLLSASELAQRYMVIWIALLIGFYAGGKFASHKLPAYRAFLEEIRLKIPIMGRLYRQMIMARFSHTLSTLLAAGLPMIEAIKTTADVLNSPRYSGELLEMSGQIESGETLSHSLLANRHWPTMIGHMVAIGEKSGKIDEILETVAGFFDKEVEGITRNLSALLEPILMLLMGLGVGMVVASVIVPIYNLVSAI